MSTMQRRIASKLLEDTLPPILYEEPLRVVYKPFRTLSDIPWSIAYALTKLLTDAGDVVASVNSVTAVYEALKLRRKVCFVGDDFLWSVVKAVTSTLSAGECRSKLIAEVKKLADYGRSYRVKCPACGKEHRVEYVEWVREGDKYVPKALSYMDKCEEGWRGLVLDDEMRESLGLEPVEYASVTPWEREAFEDLSRVSEVVKTICTHLLKTSASERRGDSFRERNLYVRVYDAVKAYCDGRKKARRELGNYVAYGTCEDVVDCKATLCRGVPSHAKLALVWGVSDAVNAERVVKVVSVGSFNPGSVDDCELLYAPSRRELRLGLRGEKVGLWGYAVLIKPPTVPIVKIPYTPESRVSSVGIVERKVNLEFMAPHCTGNKDSPEPRLETYIKYFMYKLARLVGGRKVRLKEVILYMYSLFNALKLLPTVTELCSSIAKTFDVIRKESVTYVVFPKKVRESVSEEEAREILKALQTYMDINGVGYSVEGFTLRSGDRSFTVVTSPENVKSSENTIYIVPDEIAPAVRKSCRGVNALFVRASDVFYSTAKALRGVRNALESYISKYI